MGIVPMSMGGRLSWYLGAIIKLVRFQSVPCCQMLSRGCLSPNNLADFLENKK